MKIFVKAKTGAKEDKIENVDETHFTVFVKARPEKGKANAAILKIIANNFKTSLSCVKILSGKASKKKVIEIH